MKCTEPTPERIAWAKAVIDGGGSAKDVHLLTGMRMGDIPLASAGKDRRAKILELAATKKYHDVASDAGVCPATVANVVRQYGPPELLAAVRRRRGGGPRSPSKTRLAVLSMAADLSLGIRDIGKKIGVTGERVRQIIEQWGTPELIQSRKESETVRRSNPKTYRPGMKLGTALIVAIGGGTGKARRFLMRCGCGKEKKIFPCNIRRNWRCWECSIEQMKRDRKSDRPYAAIAAAYAAGESMEAICKRFNIPKGSLGNAVIRGGGKLTRRPFGLPPKSTVPEVPDGYTAPEF